MESNRLIPVVLKDGTPCRMASRTLDVFIANDLVEKFARSDGWAKVGTDPLRRRTPGPAYRGPERRRQRKNLFIPSSRPRP